MVGRIHSIETFGTVDGPGVRVVVFLQGCLLRCIYCHNPDSWKLNVGKELTEEELFLKVKDYEPYIKNGGITLSGGEPLLQAEFIIRFFKLCKAHGFHTACDTAGSVDYRSVIGIFKYVDLFLLDIKALDSTDCIKICGVSSKNTLNFLNYCETIGKKVWIRHVIVPGYSLNFEKLNKLAGFLKNFSCIEKIELLPFHKMGEFKWRELKLNYSLKNCRVPTKEEIDRALKIFKLCGLNVC